MQLTATTLQPVGNPARSASTPSTASGGRDERKSMSTNRRHRVLRLFSSLVVAAALAASLATAADGSDATLRNDAAHYGWQSTLGASSSTFLNDTVHNRSQGAPAQQSPAAIVVRVEGGFDWISAAVGAAGGCGLLLVLGVATAALRRRERIDAAQA